MAWPPILPPSNRTNATVEADNHPTDHNLTALALADIVAQVNGSAVVPFTFAPYWQNYGGGGFTDGGSQRIGDRVYLQGLIASNSPLHGNLIATLPAAHAAIGQRVFALAWANMTGVTGFYRVDISGDSISLVEPILVPGAQVSWIAFDGISFDVNPLGGALDDG
jgi:hypothetical protein